MRIPSMVCPCLVWVSWGCGPALFGLSQGGGGGSAGGTVVPAPSIELQHPLGGELLRGIQQVTWLSTSETPVTVDILLMPDSIYIAQGVPDQGFFQWDTSQVGDARDYRLSLFASNEQGRTGTSESGAFEVFNDSRIYDVTFDGSGHVVGSMPPVAGGRSPRRNISSIVRGTPVVANQLAGLLDQPLELNSLDGEADQIEFVLDSGELHAGTHYSIEIGVAVDEVESAPPTDGFSLPIIDTDESVIGLSLTNTGVISVNDHIGFTDIGNWTVGVPFSVRFEFDLSQGSVLVELDGVTEYTHPDGIQAGWVEGFRVGQGGFSRGFRVAIDNVRVDVYD